MAELAYRIELLSDVVVTADSATEGGHVGLDYLPGSLFLGVAASAIQPFDPKLLLSGRVRFLNAYPLYHGKETHHVPLSYHSPKGGKSEVPVNLLISKRPDNQQMEQCRKGYAPVEGVPIVKIRLNNQLKSAIQRDKRRSEDGKLFDYSSIPAGTEFMMKIQCDRKDDRKTIDDVFNGKTLHLGRSRSAEYGLARCTEHEANEPQGEPGKFEDNRNRIALYLASDLALVRNGMPVLQPEPSDFGLEQATYCSAESYLQIRRYSPWNSFYNAYTTERQVLCKGSVLVFDTLKPADPKAIQQRLASGVGLHVEEGLGQVWVNPAWLLKAPTISAAKPSNKPTPSKPGTPLVRFLSNKAERLNLSRDAFETAMKWADDWMTLYAERGRGGRDDHADKMPSKSQWSNVRNIAVANLLNPDQLAGELERFCTQSLRRKKWGDPESNKSMYSRVRLKIEQNPDASTCLTLQHAAVEMGRRIDALNRSKREEP